MPTEPNLNVTSPESATLSSIENEIPAYRAISPEAVMALVLGVLSVLSFASWYFLTFPVAAILIGSLAERKIRRFPEVLTGRGLSQAGVALGLIFGLTAVTVTTVQGAIRVSQAKGFARAYEKILRQGSFADAVYYGQHPGMRATSTPKKMLDQMSKPGPGQSMFEEQYGPIREIKKALAKKADLHLVRVESHGEQELTQFAGVVFAVHSDAAKDPADRERHALAVFKWAGPSNPTRGWWVTDVIFPYKDKSFLAPAPTKKADDGHGHAH